MYVTTTEQGRPGSLDMDGSRKRARWTDSKPSSGSNDTVRPPAVDAPRPTLHEVCTSQATELRELYAASAEAKIWAVALQQLHKVGHVATSYARRCLG